MVRLGLRALITCVDPQQAPRELAGRWYDEALLSDLPSGVVDPCGENGEFHTFVVDGPGFTRSVEVAVGRLLNATASSSPTWFRPLIPMQPSQSSQPLADRQPRRNELQSREPLRRNLASTGRLGRCS